MPGKQSQFGKDEAAGGESTATKAISHHIYENLQALPNPAYRKHNADIDASSLFIEKR